MSRNTGFNIRKVTEKYISKEKKVLFTINTQSGLGLCPFNLHPIFSSSAQKKYIFLKFMPKKISVGTLKISFQD